MREGTTRSGLGEGRDFRYIGAVDLFGHWRQPLLVHLQVRRETGSIILRWDARRGRALSWRVLRSERSFAEGAFDHTVVGLGQILLAESANTGARDDDAAALATYFYAVFAEDERGEWHRLAKVKLSVTDPRLGHRAEGDFEAGGATSGWLDAGVLDTARSRGTPR